MRELTLIGLDVDGSHIICEGGNPADKFLIRLDDRLRAAVRGERSKPPGSKDNEVKGVLRPKDIQARIRAGASVQEVAEASGMDVAKVDRFAHPVLLERQRAAELAGAAHPILADGPAVATLLETVTAALADRGLSSENTMWDAWKGEDGRWTVQMSWQAGLSENVAHFRFSPGAHGGTVTAIDEAASELIDPDFERPLRPVASVAELDFEPAFEPAEVVVETTQVVAQVVVEQTTAPLPLPLPVPAQRVVPETQPQPRPQPKPQAPAQPRPAAAKRAGRKPAIPAWEDVLLGVRTSGER